MPGDPSACGSCAPIATSWRARGTSGSRIGLLGGTFNPPHLAHLLLASEAHGQLGLDRVLLVPAATPPHKEVPADPGAEVRARLCDVAVAGDERLGVSRVELGRAGPSYTVDTLSALQEARPQDELTFIVGGDMALGLPAWRHPERILGLARLAVAERSGARREELAERLGPLDPGGRVAFFDLPRFDVSSSEVRRRVAAGLPIRYLVPDAVADEIARRGLYREAVRA